MSERITLDVPDLLLSRARGVASYTSQPLEHVLLTWLQQAAQDVPVEVLSDAQVLELRDRQMDRQQQDRLHDLLARQREQQLTHGERAQLDQLMGMYRYGMLRKAQALSVAVARGLQPPLGS